MGFGALRSLDVSGASCLPWALLFAGHANQRTGARSVVILRFTSPDAKDGQTPSLGVSTVSGLFELWLHGICNSRSRVTTASGKCCDCSVTCSREISLHFESEDKYASSVSPDSPPEFHC